MDLIIGSRELLRGKIRAMQLLNLGTQTLLVVVFTLHASTNSLGVNAPYWLFAVGGVIVGTGLALTFTRRRTLSPSRQQAAINRSWRYARAWAVPTRRQRRLVTTTVVGVVVACVAVILAVFWIGDWSHLDELVLPLFGASVGLWLARTLRTFRWATWFGPGAMDPDVAGELVRATVKAQKVQYYAEIYAQNHPTTNGEPS